MTTTSATDLGPLDWRIGITDHSGRPTPEFQRRWNTQRNNNSLIKNITVGSGAPGDPVPADGNEYVDVSSDPNVLYVASNGSWVKVGVYQFTQLSDVPHSYSAAANKLVNVNSTADGLQFITVSGALDLIGLAKGDILYRDTSSWSVLAPGTSGYLLQTNGAGAIPSWTAAPTGTVTSVSLSAPLGGGTVTGSGTLGTTSFTSHGVLLGAGTSALGITAVGAANTFLAGVASADPVFRAPVLASADFANQGTTTTLLHGNASGNPSWGAVNLSADVTGNLAVSHLNSGTSASSSTFWRGDGTWAVPTGGVTSVGLSAPPIFTVSGSPVTTTGTLTFTLNTQAANLVLSGPTIGSAATPTFRALVAADIPVISPTTVPLLVIGFAIGTGATGTNVATPALAPRAGSLTKCKFVTRVSDGSTDLTVNVKKNGTTIFTSPPSITHGTSAGTVTDLSSSIASIPISVAVDDVFTLDITSGTATWAGTLQLE